MAKLRTQPVQSKTTSSGVVDLLPIAFALPTQDDAFMSNSQTFNGTRVNDVGVFHTIEAAIRAPNILAKALSGHFFVETRRNWSHA